MAATLADVAARAGVSVQTVSNALNNPRLLKRGTLDRVLAAVQELGYTPNLAARRLRQRRTHTIGLRIDASSDTISSTLLDRFLHELTAAAAAVGKHIVLFTVSSEREEVDEILALRDQSIADEFLIASTHPGDPRIEPLLAAGVPFVAFGRPWCAAPPHHWVDVDGRAGTRMATEALLDEGLERIAFVGWPAGSASGDDRREGWAAAMRERLGLDDAALEALTVRAVDGIGTAIAPVQALLEHGIEGAVCASDALAAGIVAAAGPLGVRFPVIGFDNTQLAAGVGFSSVDQRLDAVARAALASFEAAEPQTTIVRPRLVGRRDARWGLDLAAAGRWSPNPEGRS
ncbi:LacI family DNA-binding transcriptional regulator [Agrococcus sp. HG114]|uniref:LacI family DNA-binding transcriptional regulator n=1 Tax=Agrococcus sp. HG114 TaxID=2969757 RepID=UPI00215A6D0F|nr:LacI family DNA-binding transcriptional regulator [Agrococcus sp. HG114]MCR8670731.1 LacI family transcriptional regulator [Agrococcus sp. HG114]